MHAQSQAIITADYAQGLSVLSCSVARVVTDSVDVNAIQAVIKGCVSILLMVLMAWRGGRLTS